MTVGLDASVIEKWVFVDRAEESHSFQALQILQLIKEARLAVVQPPHWLAEVIARLDPGRDCRAVSLLDALELPIRSDVEVYQKACDLSTSLAQHVLIRVYHAVALHEFGASLVAADERYYRRAYKLGRVVRLQDFVPSA